MIRYFQNRFALSEKGAKSLAGGIVFTVLLNIALMLPAVFVFMFLTDYLQPVIDPQNTVLHGFWYYLSIAVVFMAVAFAIALLQYTNTYSNIYTESGNRRISLAEKLRKLPLAFFGEKNLSDLTSTIMEDCTSLEQIFSHAVPQLFASVLSMFIIAVSLFFYDWRPLLGGADGSGNFALGKTSAGQSICTPISCETWGYRASTGRIGMCTGNQIVLRRKGL